MKIFTVFVVVSTDVIEAQLSNNIEKSDHYQNKYIEKSYPECKDEFQLFNQRYLKGVKPYYTTTSNDITQERCMELCCNQPKEKCKSFSYFVDLKVCYLMNVTQFDNFVILKNSKSFIHFHRSIQCSHDFCEKEGMCIMKIDGGKSVPTCICKSGFSGLTCQFKTLTSLSLTSYLVLFSMLGLCLIFVLGALVVFCMINKRQRIKSSLKQQHHQHIDIEDVRRNEDFISDNEQDLRCGSSTVGSVSSTKTTVTNLSI